jgi:hypothetical protein
MTGKSKDSVKQGMARHQVRGRPLTVRERRELRALEKVPEHRIDTSDIPEITDWKKLRIGHFFRGTKGCH